MDRVDAVVVGQGLAGTALTWALRWRGLRVVAIDRGEPQTASRVAAGLVTPITGRRLTRTWRLDELWPAAEAFYRRAEAETGAEFFRIGPSVRLLASESERAVYEGRAAGAFGGRTGPPDPPVRPRLVRRPTRRFAMAPAARLDVLRYLDASRARLAQDGGYRPGEVNPATDVVLTPDGVRLDRFGLAARWLVFCQGIDAAVNPWFGGVRLHPVKGEVLTLRVPGLAERRVIHRGVWLAPLGGELFLAGRDLRPQRRRPRAVGAVGTRCASGCGRSCGCRSR